MTFDQIIGQDSIKQRLLDDVRLNRVPHALMLCGAEGTGALPLAVAMAQYLLCSGKEPKAQTADMFGGVDMFGGNDMFGGSGVMDEKESAAEQQTEPQMLDHACGECLSCRMSQKLQHPDLHLIFPIYNKAKSPKKSYCDDFVAEFRELFLSNPYMTYADWLEASGASNQQLTIYESESDAINQKLAYKSSQGGNKVCIIWLPEKMNTVCANKMLKLLEEPPSETIFLLVSERPDLVLGTIRSRTQMIEVPALPAELIEHTLVESYSVLPAMANRIARTAAGSMSRAIAAITEESDNREYFDLFVSLMRLSYMRRVKEMKQWSEQVAAMGRERQKSMLDYLQHMIRENFIYNFHRPELNYMTDAEAEFAVRFAPFINERNVIGIMKELEYASRDIAQNGNAKIVFFDFALKMIVLIKNR